VAFEERVRKSLTSVVCGAVRNALQLVWLRCCRPDQGFGKIDFYLRSENPGKLSTYPVGTFL
jgi:hypothetical protein